MVCKKKPTTYEEYLTISLLASTLIVIHEAIGIKLNLRKYTIIRDNLPSLLRT